MTPEKQSEQQLSDFKHIVRVANVDLPGNRSIRIALTQIKGIGINFSDMVCAAAKIDRFTKTGNLSSEQINLLNLVVQNPSNHGIPFWAFNRRKDYQSGNDQHIITGTLNFVKDNDLKRLKKIKTLRGVRHLRGLPVRGQRTRSNFRKNKGRVVGVKKKAAPAVAGKGSTAKETTSSKGSTTKSSPSAKSSAPKSASAAKSPAARGAPAAGK